MRPVRKRRLPFVDLRLVAPLVISSSSRIIPPRVPPARRHNSWRAGGLPIRPGRPVCLIVLSSMILRDKRHRGRDDGDRQAQPSVPAPRRPIILSQRSGPTKRSPRSASLLFATVGVEHRRVVRAGVQDRLRRSAHEISSLFWRNDCWYNGPSFF